MDVSTWISQNPASGYATVEDAMRAAFAAGQANPAPPTNIFPLIPGNRDYGFYQLNQINEEWRWEFTDGDPVEPDSDFGPFVDTRDEAIDGAISDAFMKVHQDHLDVVDRLAQARDKR